MAETPITIPITRPIDAILARMQVREAASKLNLGRMEQARISLAVYNVIVKMNMGLSCIGEVLVRYMKEGERNGVQVECITKNGKNGDYSDGMFGDAQWLVDEIRLEKTAPMTTRVVMAIWAS